MSKTLLIAIPTMGTLRAELCAWLQNQPYSYFLTVNVSPVSKARNQIVDIFLNQSEHDYLLMVDSDTVPPADAIEKLMALEADVATGVTPIVKGNKLSWNVYKTHPEVEEVVTYEDKEPFEVVGCGASCLLISRETLKALKQPYFKTIEFDNGAYCSEDLYFCEQVTKAGKKIMCEPSVQCAHHKGTALSFEETKS